MKTIALIFLSWMMLASVQAAPPSPYELGRKNSELQSGLTEALSNVNLLESARNQKLGVALLDITNPKNPKYAGINDNLMMYAASLPKLVILLGLYRGLEKKTLSAKRNYETWARLMIQDSTNAEATQLFYEIGPLSLLKMLLSPPFKFYDETQGGGLWIGKEYGENPAWFRDPILNLSHAATARQVARFYYMLDAGLLVSPKYTTIMKELLSHTNLYTKFARGLMDNCPDAKFYRKSGSWREFHSDSVLVEHQGKRYIAVALAQDEQGDRWLEELIVELDSLIVFGR